jgi:hypothetical protein
MAPEALRRRLAHGNVYPPERIDAALGNYFRTGNLTALRELALLWVADRVDEELNDYRERHNIAGPWETKERVVVSLTGSPGQRRAHPPGRPDGHADQGRAGRGPRPHRRQPHRAGSRAWSTTGPSSTTSAAATSRWSEPTWPRPWSRWPGPRTPPSW